MQCMDLILMNSSPNKFISTVNHKQHLPCFFFFSFYSEKTLPLNFILVNKIANEGILIKVNAFPLPSR